MPPKTGRQIYVLFKHFRADYLLFKKIFLVIFSFAKIINYKQKTQVSKFDCFTKFSDYQSKEIQTKGSKEMIYFNLFVSHLL